MYGPADHSLSNNFLDDLSSYVSAITCPVVIGGDFNLIREDSDKSSGNICHQRMQLFNDTLADLERREIARVGARYTWTNHQINPIHSVLDRVFVSPSWELVYPLSQLKAETRLGSDHTPLIFFFGRRTS